MPDRTPTASDTEAAFAWEEEHARAEFELIARQFRTASVAAFAVLIGGIGFYRTVEGLSWVDSFFFCVVTLATVGYGDIVPTTDAGKVFTGFYILIGFGLLAAFATTLGKHVMARRHYRELVHRRIAIARMAVEAEGAEDKS